MSEFSDLEVMAYVDGELSAERAAALRQALSGDAGLRTRVEVYAASRRILERSFEPALHAPLPERLLQLIDPPSTLATPRRGWHPPTWALAAAVGVLALGLGWWRPPAPERGTAPLPAFVSAALERAASGERVQVDGQEVVPLATLRLADGHYCRDYAARAGDEEQRGRACREPGGSWLAQRLETTPSTGYQPAAGADTVRLVDADEEAALIANGWREPRR